MDVVLPLGTKGKTHTPKVYANLCQNVCITGLSNEMYYKFLGWQCFILNGA